MTILAIERLSLTKTELDPMLSAPYGFRIVLSLSLYIRTLNR